MKDPNPLDVTAMRISSSSGVITVTFGPRSEIVGALENELAATGVPNGLAGLGGTAEVAGVVKSTLRVPETTKLVPSTRLVLGSAR